MNPTIRIFNHIEQIAQYAGTRLALLVSEAPEGSCLSIALAGGSTPKTIFSFIAKHFKNNIQWEKVLLFWGDERCVFPESEESNYKMAKESLLDHIPIPSSNIFRIRGEEDPVPEAERYSGIVKQSLPLLDGIPVFDLFMLGMGEDGHTVSIFPANQKLFESNKLFEATENPYTRQKRITATGLLINQAREVIFLVTGESKAEMVSGIIEKKSGYENLPVGMVFPRYGKLTWLLDKLAATKLQQDR